MERGRGREGERGREGGREGVESREWTDDVPAHAICRASVALRASL